MSEVAVLNLLLSILLHHVRYCLKTEQMPVWVILLKIRKRINETFRMVC